MAGPSRRSLARPQRVFYCLPCSHYGSGQSGRGADDPRRRISATSAATSALIDLVHDEVVYRREVMRTPIRALAAEIGVSKSAVDTFHKLRSNPGKLWPKLRDWYMRTRHSRPHEEYQTPPEELLASALHILSTVPNDRRAPAMQILVESVTAIHAGLPTPAWVQMLADLAEREAAN